MCTVLLVIVYIHEALEINGVECYVAVFGMLRHVCPLVNATIVATLLVYNG